MILVRFFIWCALGLIIAYSLWPIACLWMVIFPIVEVETNWDILYNLFVCAGFAGCYFLPLGVVVYIQRRRQRQR